MRYLMFHRPPVNGVAHGTHFERLEHSHTLRMHRTLGPHVHRHRSRLPRLVDLAVALVWLVVGLVLWLGWRPG